MIIRLMIISLDNLSLDNLSLDNMTRDNLTYDNLNCYRLANIHLILIRLRHVVLYCALSPYDNEQSDLLHRIKEDKNLEELPVFEQLVKLFTTPEIINWTELGEDC